MDRVPAGIVVRAVVGVRGGADAVLRLDIQPQAMALAKDLTTHSLPEIGDAFGGRDHTTVLHACRKMKELLEAQVDIAEDWKNLIRILSA